MSHMASLGDLADVLLKNNVARPISTFTQANLGVSQTMGKLMQHDWEMSRAVAPTFAFRR